MEAAALAAIIPNYQRVHGDAGVFGGARVGITNRCLSAGEKTLRLAFMPEVRIGNNLSTAPINHQTNATVHKHQRQRATVKPFAGVSVLVVRGKCKQA